MKSVRLTENMRRNVRERLLTHAFGKRQQELRADDEIFGGDVYETVYDALVRRRMKSMPEGFFRLASYLKVAFGGQQDQVVWRGLRPIASKHEYDRAASYVADHPLSQRSDALEKRRRDLKTDREAAYQKIKAVLASCSTLRQLVEIWPEAEPFVRDFQVSGPAAVTALALPIKSLNEQLGLPPGGGSSVKAAPVVTTKVMKKVMASSLHVS